MSLRQPDRARLQGRGHRGRDPEGFADRGPRGRPLSPPVLEHGESGIDPRFEQHGRKRPYQRDDREGWDVQKRRDFGGLRGEYRPGEQRGAGGDWQGIDRRVPPPRREEFHAAKREPWKDVRRVEYDFPDTKGSGHKDYRDGPVKWTDELRAQERGQFHGGRGSGFAPHPEIARPGARRVDHQSFDRPEDGFSRRPGPPRRDVYSRGTDEPNTRVRHEDRRYDKDHFPAEPWTDQGDRYRSRGYPGKDIGGSRVDNRVPRQYDLGHGRRDDRQYVDDRFGPGRGRGHWPEGRRQDRHDSRPAPTPPYHGTSTRDHPRPRDPPPVDNVRPRDDGRGYRGADFRGGSRPAGRDNHHRDAPLPRDSTRDVADRPRHRERTREHERSALPRDVEDPIDRHTNHRAAATKEDLHTGNLSDRQLDGDPMELDRSASPAASPSRGDEGPARSEEHAQLEAAAREAQTDEQDERTTRTPSPIYISENEPADSIGKASLLSGLSDPLCISDDYPPHCRDTAARSPLQDTAHNEKGIDELSGGDREQTNTARAYSPRRNMSPVSDVLPVHSGSHLSGGLNNEEEGEAGADATETAVRSGSIADKAAHQQSNGEPGERDGDRQPDSNRSRRSPHRGDRETRQNHRGDRRDYRDKSFRGDRRVDWQTGNTPRRGPPANRDWSRSAHGSYQGGRGSGQGGRDRYPRDQRAPARNERGGPTGQYSRGSAGSGQRQHGPMDRDRSRGDYDNRRGDSSDLRRSQDRRPSRPHDELRDRGAPNDRQARGGDRRRDAELDRREDNTARKHTREDAAPRVERDRDRPDRDQDRDRLPRENDRERGRSGGRDVESNVAADVEEEAPKRRRTGFSGEADPIAAAAKIAASQNVQPQLTAEQKKKLIWGSKKAEVAEANVAEPAEKLFGTNRWDTAQVGPEKSKFLRLMGVKNADSAASARPQAGDEMERTVLDRQAEEQLNSTLEHQFRAGLRRADGRTAGLGT